MDRYSHKTCTWKILVIRLYFKYFINFDWKYYILTPHRHIFKRICNYLFLCWRLSWWSHAKNKKCIRHIVKWQNNYFKCAIFGLNAIKSGICTEFVTCLFLLPKSCSFRTLNFYKVYATHCCVFCYLFRISSVLCILNSTSYTYMNYLNVL